MEQLKVLLLVSDLDLNAILVVTALELPSVVLGAVDEGQFVRRRRIIIFLAFSGLYHYCVAYSQDLEHLDDVVVIVMTSVFQMLVEIRVLHAEVGNFFLLDVRRIRLVHTVRVLAD